MTARPSRRAPGTPPVLDPHTVTAGVPLEDYTWLDTAQSYPRRGPQLPWQGWSLLPEALKHRVIRGLISTTRARHVDVLTEHGLLSNGRLTPAGREIAEVLGRPGPRLAVHATGADDRRHVLDVLIGGPTAVILASTAPSAPPSAGTVDDAALLTLEVVDVTWAPAAIAAWTGTAPAWSLSITPTSVDVDVLTRHLRDHDVPPPPDADAHLRDVWDQPWWLWQLETSGTSQPLAVLHAGRRGCYRLCRGPQRNTAELIPTPARLVWAALLQAVETAVNPAAP